MGTAAMSSRERVLAAINRRPVDRVPLDIWATPEVWQKLRSHFGDGVDIRAALHIDGFGGGSAPYLGPPPPPAPPGETVNYWGIRTRAVSYGTGSYQEVTHHPLAAARSIDDLEKYAWPQPEHFDYQALRRSLVPQRAGRAIQCGYMATFYFHNQLRGLEQSLIDPIEDPDFTRHLLHRLGDFFHEHHRRMFEACDGLIDVAQVTDDLGTQHGPMIGLDLWRTFYKPHMQRHIDLCRQFGIKVFHHDDGAIRDFLPDLVDMGIDVLNPIQWRCPGMDLRGLKDAFGDRLCFHGAVDNQQTLPHGSPAEVRAQVRDLIDVLARDRTGYILAPCHNLQAITPVENILAMYDEAWRCGRFS
jgi:uroporphyrinogen decarboxylase